MRLEKKKILVAGDLMLDLYTFGEVERISPEAPVPVLRVKEESRRPGGAGNALLNILSLGMEVVALGRVGEDRVGSTLLEILYREGVDTRGLFIDKSYQTPKKNRMIAAGQQLLRTDYETPQPLPPPLQERVIETLPQLLEGVSVVAISDYAKGFLTPSLLAALIREAKRRSIPIIVDPKGNDFSRYRGASLLKPNFSEAVAAAGLGMEATLDEIAQALYQKTAIGTLIITRSKEGISLFSKGEERRDFSASVHEVKDVTGAGDTVLALFTAAVANRLPLEEACYLANIAAGMAIERIGCARITADELVARLDLTHS